MLYNFEIKYMKIEWHKRDEGPKKQICVASFMDNPLAKRNEPSSGIASRTLSLKLPQIFFIL